MCFLFWVTAKCESYYSKWKEFSFIHLTSLTPTWPACQPHLNSRVFPRLWVLVNARSSLWNPCAFTSLNSPRGSPQKTFADEAHSAWVPSSSLTPCASVTVPCSIWPLVAPSQGSNPQSCLWWRRQGLSIKAHVQLRWTPPSLPADISLPLTFRWACSLMRWKESSSSFFSRSKSTWACLATDTCLVTSAFCKERTVSWSGLSQT